MANTEAPAPSSAYVEDLFRARYLEMVRLAGLLGADDLAIVHEDHREVIAALADLPVRRREAIVLRYWLDLPEREIAAAMGVSLGTVKSHVSRGLAALGRALPGIPAGTVTGYLVDGRVGFWSPLFEDDAAICPVPAGGQPVLDGLVTSPSRAGRLVLPRGWWPWVTRTRGWRACACVCRTASYCPFRRSRRAGGAATCGCGPSSCRRTASTSPGQQHGGDGHGV